MINPLDFTGKTVLVTGGGAGIGRAIAEAFAGQGARLIIAEIDTHRAADVAAALGDAASVHVVDVTDRAAVRALAAEIAGPVDVLVNNVGHFLAAKPFESLEDDEVDAILGVNLLSVIIVTRAMLPHLRAAGPGASIINLTSIEGFRGIPNCSIYAAAKAGIAGLTKSLALELAPAGVRINDIAPETTETPQVPVTFMIAAEHRPHIERWIPLGRFGQPSDCAGAALYLASPLAAWVTGTTIHVDGGALAAAGWTRDPKGNWTIVPVVTGNGFNF
jgi:NAD(P)-dependent dehydrogenase (short-subunit alcohol dehydrogenase family)